MNPHRLDDDLLVSLVRDNPLLYKKNFSAGKNTEEKERIWADISSNLNTPVKNCKTRWAYLRQKYGKEKKRLSGSPEKTSSWRLYKPLDFLSEFVISRKPRMKKSVVKLEDFTDTAAPPSSPVATSSVGSNCIDPTTNVQACLEDNKENIFNSCSCNNNNVIDRIFGEYIKCELASFQNNHHKDLAKQEIVNIVYKYKN